MKQLARRERLALIACGVFVALFVVMQFGVFPVLDHWHRLQRGIEVRARPWSRCVTCSRVTAGCTGRPIP